MIVLSPSAHWQYNAYTSRRSRILRILFRAPHTSIEHQVFVPFFVVS